MTTDVGLELFPSIELFFVLFLVCVCVCMCMCVRACVCVYNAHPVLGFLWFEFLVIIAAVIFLL